MSNCWHKKNGVPIHPTTQGCEWYEAKIEFKEALIKFLNRLKAIVLLHIRRVIRR